MSPRVQQLLEEAAELPPGLAQLVDPIQSLPRRAETLPERHAVIAERVARVRSGEVATLSVEEVALSAWSRRR